MTSPKKIRKRLRSAQNAEQLVLIRRSPRHAGLSEGFVVGVGDGWLVLAEIRDGGYLDGFRAIRVEDVTEVTVSKTFEATVSRSLPQWPPSMPVSEADLRSTGALIHAFADAFPLIALHRETKSNAYFIGELDGTNKKWVSIHTIGKNADWADDTSWYRLKTVTSIRVASGYMAGLSSVAEPAPSLPHVARE
jgi:hypothetical protein